MGIILAKNLKQKQNIKLTPSLKKSIDLLQLSRFELIKKIEKEMDENPFLEKEENSYETNSSYDKNFDFDIESKLTLRENLIDQLTDFQLSKKEIEISKLIIDCIDESGKLAEEIHEIEEISKFTFQAFEIEEVLKTIIQKLSPYGVGYRDHKECIKIQIDNSHIPKKKKLIIMKILFNERLDNFKEIEESMIREGLSKKDFDDAVDEIKKCDLSPGLNFEKIKFIEPDLKISVNNNNFNVEFIQESFPIIKTDDVLINKVKEEIKLKNNNRILQKINDAKWLLTSVKKRNDTIKSVGEYICSKQVAFFDNNPLKINSLSNKEIAKELRIHPSTVSRILRYKYIETPKGIIPLKSLLVSSVSRIRDISAIQLMKLIKDTIKSEKKPKSDKKIAIELNKKGFGLARRTIAKYRKLNNIPSSRYR
ncbi:MAG: RNA polymerase sigma-54 factor [Gammaproteobacteria bacterium TMED226]|nr:MAG: RNA polymerase sigma-54 factor [Gammaproteobacteria bacterium TMED226]